MFEVNFGEFVKEYVLESMPDFSELLRSERVNVNVGTGGKVETDIPILLVPIPQSLEYYATYTGGVGEREAVNGYKANYRVYVFNLNTKELIGVLTHTTIPPSLTTVQRPVVFTSVFETSSILSVTND